MGIYIKDMDAPKNCGECDDMFLLSTIACDCHEFGLNERPTDCPLTEVPEPHGRLIDADALIDSLNIRSVTYNCVINMCIEDAPTVVERSDKGEEE